MSRIALFDLDRTLLDVNSGRLWVQAEWREGRIRARDAAWAAWWLGRYSLGLGDRLDEVFEAAVRSVADQLEAELDDRVTAWFEREVRHHLRPGGREALRVHREAGDRLVLATSGTQYAARAAAHAFGLDEIVCTELEARDGRLTGRISTLALGPAKAVACGSQGDVTLLSIRPERVIIGAAREQNALDAKVLELIYLGDHIRCRMAVSGHEDFVVKVPNSHAKAALRVGEETTVGWVTDDCRALDTHDAA